MEAMPANPPAVAASGDSNASSAVAGAADAAAVEEWTKLHEAVKRRAKVRCNECGRACINEWSTANYPPLRKVFLSDRVCCSEACLRSYLLGKCGSASCMDEPQVAQKRKYESEISIKVSPNHEACNECGESTGSRHGAEANAGREIIDVPALANKQQVAQQRKRKKRKYRSCFVCGCGFWNTEPHFCPCRKVTYCTSECQKADWHSHKQKCPFHKIDLNVGTERMGKDKRGWVQIKLEGESTGSRHRADMPKIVTGKVNGKLLQLVRQQGDMLVKVNPDINGFDEWCVGGDNRGILVGTPTDVLRKYRMA